MKPFNKPSNPVPPKSFPPKRGEMLPRGAGKIEHSDGTLQRLRLHLLSLPPTDAARQDRIVVMIHLATVYWRRGEYPAAISLAKQAIALAQQIKDSESIIMGYLLLSTIYTHMEDFETALQNGKRAIVYAPQSAHVLFGVVIIYDLMGDQAQDEKWLQRTLAEDPDYQMAHEHTAHLHVRRGEFALAEAVYRKSMQISLDSSGTIIGLGALLIFQERFEEALTLFRHLQQIDVDPSSWYDHTGFCYYRMGKWQEATRNLEKGTELDPEDSLVSFIILGILARREAGDAARQTSDRWFQRAKEAEANSKSRMIGERLIEFDAFVALTLTGLGETGALARWQFVLDSPDTKLVNPIVWDNWFYHLQLLAHSPHSTPLVNEVIALLTQYRTAQVKGE